MSANKTRLTGKEFIALKSLAHKFLLKFPLAHEIEEPLGKFVEYAYAKNVEGRDREAYKLIKAMRDYGIRDVDVIVPDESTKQKFNDVATELKYRPGSEAYSEAKGRFDAGTRRRKNKRRTRRR